MINKCPCCNTDPIEAGMISCQNIKCLEYDESYFIWEWQALTKKPAAKDNLDMNRLLNSDDTSEFEEYFNSLGV